MIRPPHDINAHLASAWTAGIAALFLGIGFSGAGTPLLPEGPPTLMMVEEGDEVMAEEFEPPPGVEEPAAESAEPALDEPIEELEIPPVPEITPPLTPPEMAEITPLEKIVEPPKTPPSVKPPTPKPRPVVERKPQPVQGTPGGTPGGASGPQGKPGGTGNVVKAGGGKGRFPQPGYPSGARRSGLQGTVRLSVTVEASGLPASVNVIGSSGHAELDAAARDGVLRRWRWPTGDVRRFTVPVRFVLK